MNIHKYNNFFLKTFSALLCGFALTVLFKASVLADAGDTVMPILRLDVGAKQMAMSGAATSFSNDLFAMRYNPASLGLMEEMQLAGVYQDGILDTRLQYIAFGMPLPFTGLSGKYKPLLAVGVLASQNGKISANFLKADGTLGQQDQSISAGSDMVLAINYGEIIAEDVINFGYGRMAMYHSLGLGGKFLYSKLPDDDMGSLSGTAFAGDAGYKINIPQAGFGLGVSILNVGTQMKYKEQSFDLPMTFRVGGSARLGLGGDVSLNGSCDYVRYIKDAENRVFVGAELDFVSYVFLRGGYKFMQDYAKWTIGGGVKFLDFALDFAMQPDSDLENVFQIGLTWKFPMVSAKKDENQAPSSRKASPSYRDQSSSSKRPSTRYEPQNEQKEQKKPARENNLLIF